MRYDHLIVGAGFAGAVLAERLAAGLGRRVLVIDRRPHVGGIAHDSADAAGVLLHRYGPHYFRTDSARVVEYLSRFTEWHPVEYRILAWTGGRFWPFPINLNTFEQLVGHPATSREMEETLERWRVPIARPRNSEELILSQVGPALYEMFFRNYTRKQWGRDARQLDPSVCGRIPIRTDRDDRYVRERFQALPRDGYTAMFKRLLDHPNIRVELGVEFRDVRRRVDFDHLVYCGPIDEYFEWRFGPLPYRTLRFEPETVAAEWFQPAVQVNYPNDHDFTRIVEIKHVTGQRLPITTIVREYPEECAAGRDPFYPIPSPENRALHGRYLDLAAGEAPGVTFLGRLARYRYCNMDHVVATALAEFDRLRRTTGS